MTYSVYGTQYVAVMAGWGGPTTLANRSIGKGKIGRGRLAVFTIWRDSDSGSSRANRFTRPDADIPARGSRSQIDQGANLFATFACAATAETS